MNSKHVSLLLITILLVATLFSATSCQQATKAGVNAQKRGDAERFENIDSKVLALMKEHNVPGVSVALIKDGKPIQSRSYGIKQAGKTDVIDEKTVFSVGSVSKVANALVALKLVSDGKLDLDEDVNKYLKSWKVPASEFTKDNPITLRHLLSHTAGLSVHGFADYYPGETLPTPIQTLNGERPAKNGKVDVIFEPGSRFKYSGGGTTVVQQIIADVTGMPYEKATEKILFEPLGIKRASFVNPLPKEFGNIAKAHDRSGKAVALPRGYQAMPEMAASGLWTTPGELLKILTSTKDGFLKSEIVEDMITSEKNTTYGLGPRIAKHDRGTLVSHGGSNESYKASFSILWEEKTGFAVFTNSGSGADLIRDLDPTIREELGL